MAKPGFELKCSSLSEKAMAPFQYSCLENPMDRGAWEAAVRGVAEESDWTEHACTHARRFQARGSHTLVRELLAFISHELSEADGDND